MAGQFLSDKPSPPLLSHINWHMIICTRVNSEMQTNMYSHFRNYAPPLDEKGGILTEKVFPVFSERVFRACFGLVI